MGVAEEFCTTHWSVVALAAGAPSPEAEAALEKLCRAYWKPVYAFIRWHGYLPQDAEDLTQEFFAELLARHDLAGVESSRGKFRSFLIACLNHFLAKDWRDRNALKRGGGKEFVPIDGVEVEGAYAKESVRAADASAVFDREWATAILDKSLTSLEDEQFAAGKSDQFLELRVFLLPATSETGYEQIAERLRMTPAAVTTAVHRLRLRYRELVRKAVSETVTTPLELQEEMGYLLRVLSQ